MTIEAEFRSPRHQDLSIRFAASQANVDAYNLFNRNTPVTLFGTYDLRWGQPTQVLDGRLVEFSAQFDF